MTNCPMSDISQYEDINTIDQYQVALRAGCTEAEALEACYLNSRDNARTPMQWSGAANGGFTTGTPWLVVNPNYREITAAEEAGRPDSLLNCYKRLIALRKSDAYADTFIYGGFVPAYETEPDILAYLRKGQEQTILVAGNYGETARTLTLDGPAEQVLLTNTGREAELLAQARDQGRITLESCESAVILLWIQ